MRLPPIRLLRRFDRLTAGSAQDKCAQGKLSGLAMTNPQAGLGANRPRPQVAGANPSTSSGQATRRPLKAAVREFSLYAIVKLPYTIFP
jgi:hypothetical protein